MSVGLYAVAALLGTPVVLVLAGFVAEVWRGGL